jgi:hypothetical protein
MRKLIIISLLLPLLYCPIGCSKGNEDTTKTKQPPKKAAEESNAIDRSDFDPFMKTFTKAITNGNKAAYQEVLPNPGYQSDLLESLEGATVLRMEIYQNSPSLKTYGVFLEDGRSFVVTAKYWQGEIKVNLVRPNR